MSPFYILFIVEQAIWIPVIFCLVRWKVVRPTYLPLFLYLVVKGILEFTANLMAIHYHGRNAPPYNILLLCEAFFISWQLYNMGAFGGRKKLYYALQIFSLFVWVIDINWIGSFYQFNFLHHILLSFILLFVSASLLGKLTVSIRYNIIRNTTFWLCIVFCLGCMYNIMYEVVEYLSYIQPSLQSITTNVTFFIECMAAATYFVICWAIYCIPKMRKISFDI